VTDHEPRLIDPYEPPRSRTEHDAPRESLDVELRIASTGQRFVNLILDSLFLYAASAALFFLAGLLLAATGYGAEYARAIEQVPDLLLGVLISFLYYVPQEAFGGRTLAKLITGTRVVCEDGSPVTLGKVLGRTASRMIPFEPFSFLGGGGRPVGLHDRLPKTRVITTRRR
jgi:uncharacterized RDD family membrane protein YckC